MNMKPDGASLRSLPPEGARPALGRPGVGPTAEHEFEAAHGLPEPLPAGERILWQGAPDFKVMAERCFHVRTFAIYFAVILLIRSATVAAQGGSASEALVAALWLAPAAALALALLALMAWLTSRTTVYTITDRRVVMRVGIVLTVTFNLPFSRIESAAVNLRHGQAGDIALTTTRSDQIAYVHLWPHARPWHVRRTEPALRCIADADAVSRILSRAWRAARGADAAPPESQVAAPVRPATLPSFAPAMRRIEPDAGLAAH